MALSQSLSPLPDLPRPSQSPTLSNVSSTSDDVPQLSFEYRWDDEGNYVRISKKQPTTSEFSSDHRVLEFIQGLDGLSSNPALNEILGNERTADNQQSIAAVLSRSHSAAPTTHERVSSAALPSSRPFNRVASGPAASSSGHRSGIAIDRPIGRARRVPIDAKRKEDNNTGSKEAEQWEWESLRMRDHEKENWASEGTYAKGEYTPALSSSLTRTQSDPFPVQLEGDQNGYQPSSQPLEPIQSIQRLRRPLAKQRGLSGVPRPITKEFSDIRSSGGGLDIRSHSGNLEVSPQDVPRPRPTGGARRITKEERQRQEREAEKEAAEIERKQKLSELEEEDRERELRRTQEEQNPPQSEIPREQNVRSTSTLAYGQADVEEKPREKEKLSRISHQRRESETVMMPGSSALPARLSPSARNISPRESNIAGPPSQYQHPDHPPGLHLGLSRSNSTTAHPSQSGPVSTTASAARGQHRRSPTAPEAHQSSLDLGHHMGAVMAKGKVWATGMEALGDVDHDLGEMGMRDKEPVREATRLAPSAVAIPAPIQFNGAKSFTVNGKTYGKLDMIGKGGSSRVYRVITPSNEIYALKRVSLDRTDQETMQGYMNEIALLRRLDGNDRIIRLIESEVKGGSKGHLMLVMECGEVDLARLIAARQSSPLDIVWVAYYWKQMLEAVQVIHEEKIVHSDLKPANFVLVKGELKLIDFGIANAIANDTTNIQRDHQIGTVNYMSPESIEVVEGNARLKVGRPSDVWSLGCILYQMIYGTPPFHSLSVLQKMRAIPDPNHVIEFPVEAIPIIPQPRNNSGTAGPGGCSAPPKKLYHLARPVPMEVIESLRNCLTKNPKDRETIPQLLAAGWLHPKGRSEELNLASDEVIIDKDLLRQVITWAISVGATTGMPKDEEFQDILDSTLIQLQSCQRKR